MRHPLRIFILALFSLIALVSSQTQRYEFKHSFRAPFYLGRGGTLPFWEFGGNAIVSEDRIRLTPALQSRAGWVWNSVPADMDAWELQVDFEIGSGGSRGADGMALWYVAEPKQEGIAMGSKDEFQGMAVILDTFDNDGNNDEPRIQLWIGDGYNRYDAGIDGKYGEVGTCNELRRDARQKIRVIYRDHVITVEVDNGGVWSPCINHHATLPKGYYFGLSAATGHLYDNHDIYSFITYNLDPWRRRAPVPVRRQDQEPEPEPETVQENQEEEQQQQQQHYEADNNNDNNNYEHEYQGPTPEPQWEREQRELEQRERELERRDEHERQDPTPDPQWEREQRELEQRERELERRERELEQRERERERERDQRQQLLYEPPLPPPQQQHHSAPSSSSSSYAGRQQGDLDRLSTQVDDLSRKMEALRRQHDDMSYSVNQILEKLDGLPHHLPDPREDVKQVMQELKSLQGTSADLRRIAKDDADQVGKVATDLKSHITAEQANTYNNVARLLRDLQNSISSLQTITERGDRDQNSALQELKSGKEELKTVVEKSGSIAWWVYFCFFQVCFGVGFAMWKKAKEDANKKFL